MDYSTGVFRLDDVSELGCGEIVAELERVLVAERTRDGLTAHRAEGDLLLRACKDLRGHHVVREDVQ